MNPHSITLDNYDAMDDQVDSLMDPYVPPSLPQAREVSSVTLIMTHLPYQLSKQGDQWTVSRPEYTADLAGFYGLNRYNLKWVGLLDDPIEPKDQAEVSEILREQGVYPVFVDQQTLSDGIVCFAESVSAILETMVIMPLLDSQYRRQRRADFRELFEGVACL